MLVLSVSSLSGQESKNPNYCNAVLEQIDTKEWVKDSLGVTGYRAKNFEQFKDCLRGKVTKEEILKKLGKPNHTTEVGFGNPWKNHIQFEYHIINIDATGKSKYFEGLYLAFIFDGEYLRMTGDGDKCG
jgi:hypothetical protein